MVDLAHDVRVLEVANDFADGVALADVGQELVAQASTLRSGALDQACDVNELDGRGDDATRVDDVRQLLQARVRYVDDTDVGIDGGERIVSGKSALLGEGGEKRRLANVGQAHDADRKCHEYSLQRNSRAATRFSPMSRRA